MANNSVANPGSGGDTFSTTDLSSFTALPTTGKAPNNIIYVGADATTAPTGVTNAHPFPVTIRNASGTELGVAAAPVQVSLANHGANATAVKVDGSAVTQPVSLASVPSHAVTNAGTFAVQIDGAALTALQLIDNLVLAEDAGHSSGDPGVQILTVRQDVAAALGQTDADYQPLITDSIGRLHVNVGNTLTVGSHAVTNAGIFAVQVDGAALTSLQLLDDSIYVDNTAFSDDASKFALIGGVYQAAPQTVTDGRVAPILLDANGKVQVAAHAVTQSGTWNVGTVTTVTTVSAVTNVATIGTSVTPGTSAAHLGKAEDAAHGSGDTGVSVLAVRRDTPAVGSDTDGDYSTLNVDASGRLWCNVNNTLTVASHAVTNAGTFPVQIDGTALTRLNDIETNTDSCAVVGNGAAATAQRVTIANDSTGVLAGVTTVTTVSTLTGSAVAHDGMDSGNPHKLGAKAKSGLTGITLVSDADRSDLYADIDGLLMVKLNVPWGDLLAERVSNTDGASTAFSTFGASANLRNYITSVTVHNAHSATSGYVDLRDGTAGSILWTFPLPATGGATHNFNPPLRQPTANTALAYDVSAAISTIYLSVNGFRSKC